MEYRKKCNVCGKIFCYTDKDLKDNAKNAGLSALEALGSLASTFGGGTIFHTAYMTEQSDRYADKVVDFDQCPYCHSRDLSFCFDDVDIKDAESKAIPAPTAKSININSGASAEALIKRAFIFLEDGEWDSADAYCEACLDINPEMAEAYLGKLMVERKARTIEDLRSSISSLSENKYYQKAVRFGSGELADRLKELRKGGEKKAQELLSIREKLMDPDCPVMCAIDNNCYVAALCTDGRLLISGKFDKSNYDAEQWKNVVSIATSWHSIFGLRADGTVVACGSNEKGQCNVSEWRDIKAICAAGNTTVGLKRDGTVVACGDNTKGQCNTKGWTDIVEIASNDDITFGVCSDGTVKHCGGYSDSWLYIPKLENVAHIKIQGASLVVYFKDGSVKIVHNKEQFAETDWSHMSDIASDLFCAIGLKENGHIVFQKNTDLSRDLQNMFDCGQKEAALWSNVAAISMDGSHIAGLKEDGTVAACGENKFRQCDTGNWHDVVMIRTAGTHTVGVCSDGSVLHCGSDLYGNSDISDWKLFKDLEDLERSTERVKSLRVTAEKAAEERRKADIAERITKFKQEKAMLEAEIPNTKGLFAAGKIKKLQERITEIDIEVEKLGKV